MRARRDAVYYAQCGVLCIWIGAGLLVSTGLYVIGVA